MGVDGYLAAGLRRAESGVWVGTWLQGCAGLRHG